jgi:hypothetical protein
MPNSSRCGWRTSGLARYAIGVSLIWMFPERFLRTASPFRISMLTWIGGQMRSVKERYQSDAQFKALVDMMVVYIDQAHYTPSEMREASILASIIYAERNNRNLIIPIEVLKWLDANEPDGL